MMKRLKFAIKALLHRNKLSVAIPISSKSYELLLKFWKNGDKDLGDTITRIIEDREILAKVAQGVLASKEEAGFGQSLVSTTAVLAAEKALKGPDEGKA